MVDVLHSYYADATVLYMLLVEPFVYQVSSAFVSMPGLWFMYVIKFEYLREGFQFNCVVFAIYCWLTKLIYTFACVSSFRMLLCWFFALFDWFTLHCVDMWILISNEISIFHLLRWRFKFLLKCLNSVGSILFYWFLWSISRFVGKSSLILYQPIMWDH